MSRMQRRIVLLGTALVTLSGLIVPWRMVGSRSGQSFTRCYRFLLSPPHYTHQVFADRDEIEAYAYAKQVIAGGGQAAYYDEYKQSAAEFEAKYGPIDGPVHDSTWWWRTEDWSSVEPVIDLAQLGVQWVLILLVAGGLALWCQDKRAKGL